MFVWLATDVLIMNWCRQFVIPKSDPSASSIAQVKKALGNAEELQEALEAVLVVAKSVVLNFSKEFSAITTQVSLDLLQTTSFPSYSSTPMTPRTLSLQRLFHMSIIDSGKWFFGCPSCGPTYLPNATVRRGWPNYSLVAPLICCRC